MSQINTQDEPGAHTVTPTFGPKYGVAGLH